METFSKAPFITHDGIDANGVRAEVKVQSGLGKIEEIKKSKAGKARNVIISADNTEHLMNGWVPADDPVFIKIQEAYDNNEPVEFRIETARKRDIDRTTPINDLTVDMSTAKDNVFKAFAAVKTTEDESWTLSPKMRTRMEEDPVDTAQVDPNSISLEEFTGGTTANKQEGRSSYEPNRSIENPPYMTYNKNGEINPGSYAAAIPINILSFVITYCVEKNVDLTEQEKALTAKTIIKLTNGLQNFMYNGELEKPLLDANSHTRARAIVFEVIEAYFPITKDTIKDKNTLKEWHDNVQKKAEGLWNWSINELKTLL